MRKTLTKCLVGLLGVSLIMGLMGSFAFADEKKLTPYEWTQLSKEDKIKYRTVVIKEGTGYVPDVFSKEAKKKLEKYDELFNTCDLSFPLDWYSLSLFMLKHPEVKIEKGEVVSSYLDEAMISLASGEAVSFFYASSFGGIPAYKKLGVVADITDLVEDWDQTPVLWEKGRETWKKLWIDGRCYGIPDAVGGTLDMAFRKDWFKEAGIFDEKGMPRPSNYWSWNDLRKIAKKLTDTKKKRWGFGFAPQCGEAWGSNIPMWITLSFGNFEPWSWTVPDKSGKYTWRFEITPPLVEALQYIKDMRWKDKSMLTDVTYMYWDSYFKDFIPGRVGMAAMWTRGVGYLDPSPWHAGRKYMDDAGVAPLPLGEKTGIRFATLYSDSVGFLSTLDKEQLKLAFELWEWFAIGRGRILMLEREGDLYSIIGKDYSPNTWLLADFANSPYNLKGEVPANFRKEFEEIYPKELIEIHNFDIKVKNAPDSAEFGLDISWDGVPSEFPYIASVYQTIVSDPNADVVKELEKIRDPVNKECFSYKIEGDKEKFKEYYTAKAEFYKKNYPKFYESKLFKEMWEKYYKIW